MAERRAFRRLFRLPGGRRTAEDVDKIDWRLREPQPPEEREPGDRYFMGYHMGSGRYCDRPVEEFRAGMIDEIEVDPPNRKPSKKFISTSMLGEDNKLLEKWKKFFNPSKGKK